MTDSRSDDRTHIARQVAHWQLAARRLADLDDLASPAAWQGLEQYLGLALRRNLTSVGEGLSKQGELLAAQLAAAHSPQGWDRLSRSLVDYRIVTAVDAPQEIHGDFVETPLEDGPWGARGVGEHVMVQTAPAIANAINDARGIRFSNLPLSAEKIFLALQEDQQ